MQFNYRCTHFHRTLNIKAVLDTIENKYQLVRSNQSLSLILTCSREKHYRKKLSCFFIYKSFPPGTLFA